MIDIIREHEEWETEWIEARIWWCNDEWCNCTQPVIEHVTPNHDGGYPWIRRRRLWEGEFFSEADPEESASQAATLREAVKQYGIELDDNLWGRVVHA